MRSFTLAVLAVAILGAASVAQAKHFSLGASPDTFGWVKGAPVADDATIRLTIAVKHNAFGLKALTAALDSTSDPDSERYGQHFSKETVDALIAPAPESVRAVVSWLATVGVPEEDLEHSGNSDFITATVPVRMAEALLSASYHTYTHADSGIDIVRVEEYTLPDYVANHVDIVAPTTRFPHVMSARLKLPKAVTTALRNGATPQSVNVEPTDLRSLYNLPSSVSNQSPDNSQAAMAFLGQFINPDDVQDFFKQYFPAAAGRKFTITGPNTASNAGIEATLDVEYIMSMGNQVPTTFWSVPGQQPKSPQNEPFLVWLEAAAKMSDADVPKVFSVSYGDNEPTVDYDYAQRVNVEFQKLGQRGVSIMFSSGDGGVGGGQPTPCTTFIPTFPAGSPYVTAVGGTSGDGTSAASLSSGGFANYFARPSYQDDAVSHYFKVASNLPPANRYNSSGAGIPDVAAAAEGFVIVWNGFSTEVAGTSCASPTFSGIVALLNDLRLQAGKSTLGYLNPMIYKHPEVFTDITSGNNPGCFSAGFYAAPGWDPVTGHGAPDYTKWAALVKSLP